MIELHIEKRSHHFKVSKFTHRAKGVIEQFARRMVHWGYLREGRNLRKAPLKVFAASNHKRDEYRFHINQLDEFIQHLSENHIHEKNYELVELALGEVVKVDLPIIVGWEPREHQIDPIEYIINDDGPRQRMVCIQTGQGKAQPLDAPIYTPNGWMQMGDMQVGTEIYTKNGEVTTVTDVFPQGKKDIYKITFQDGRQTECCLDHLWEVYNPQWEYSQRTRRVISTKEIIELLKRPTNSKRLYVSLPDHPVITNRDFLVHPYVMGAFLGDGHLGSTFKMANYDSFVIEKIRNLLPPEVILKDDLNREKHYNVVFNKNHNGSIIIRKESSFFSFFDECDLIGSLSHNKSIPEQYIDTSLEQKIQLLNGLFDTDGHVNETGSIEYSTTSLKMALQVQYIVRSIGGLCKLKERQTYYPYKGEKKPGRISYRLNIRHNDPKILFTLPRKRDRISDNYQYKGCIRLRIEKIEYNGRKHAQCISVDHPSRLYITNDFIVTHNSFLSMYATSKLKHRFVLVARPMYIEKWVLDVKKTYDIPDEDILVIRGGASLMALLALCRGNQLTARVILISNKTILNFLKNYERFGDGILDIGYDYTPDDLFQVLGGGIRVIDEVHQDFHLNYKIDLYTHTMRSVSLTATMLTDDTFIERMHNVAYPKKDRYVGEDSEPYINSIAVLYQFRNRNKIRYMDTTGRNYSHHVFEQSIIKDKGILNNYLAMVGDHIQTSFVNNPQYKVGDKFIIFCTSIDMCTRVTNYLRNRLPQLSIERYVEEDPYSNLMEPDGRVTTLLSAGTAVDIDQLTHSFLHTAVNSSVSNVQGFGRLRELKDKRNPTFIYFSDMDNPKHMDYHNKKKEIIKPRSKHFKEMNYGTLL